MNFQEIMTKFRSSQRQQDVPLDNERKREWGTVFTKVAAKEHKERGVVLSEEALGELTLRVDVLENRAPSLSHAILNLAEQSQAEHVLCGPFCPPYLNPEPGGGTHEGFQDYDPEMLSTAFSNLSSLIRGASRTKPTKVELFSLSSLGTTGWTRFVVAQSALKAIGGKKAFEEHQLKNHTLLTEVAIEALEPDQISFSLTSLDAALERTAKRIHELGFGDELPEDNIDLGDVTKQMPRPVANAFYIDEREEGEGAKTFSRYWGDGNGGWGKRSALVNFLFYIEIGREIRRVANENRNGRTTVLNIEGQSWPEHAPVFSAAMFGIEGADMDHKWEDDPSAPAVNHIPLLTPKPVVSLHSKDHHQMINKNGIRQRWTIR